MRVCRETMAPAARFERWARSGINRRQDPRYPIHAWAKAWLCQAPRAMVYGHTLNISRSGVSLAIDREAARMFSAGGRVGFEVELPAPLERDVEVVFQGAGKCLRVDDMLEDPGHCRLALQVMAAQLVRHAPDKECALSANSGPAHGGHTGGGSAK